MKELYSTIIIGILIISSFGSIAGTTKDLSDYVISLYLEIPELIFSTTIIKEQSFSSLKFETEESTTGLGNACLPVINKMIEIPQGGQPTIVIRNDQWNEYSLDELGLTDRIEPVQPSVIKNCERDDFEFVINNSYYSTDSFLNIDKARILETGMIRGHRYALIQILPVQYNPVRGQLRLLEDIDIEIVTHNANIDETANMISRYKMDEYDSILERNVVNFGEFENLDQTETRATNSYLIICEDAFTGALDALVTWKTQIGFDVTVTTLSQIPGGPTRDNIQDYIQDAYDDWSSPPGYVLLAGDTSQIPAFDGQSSNTATDLYYVTTAGSDYMPDILIGRFPGSQVSHITAMVDKTVGYEQGYWSDDSFLNKGSFMAGSDNYHITEGTHNFVISNYFDPKGWECDKLYQVTYGASTQDVQDALSDGRVAAIYSGHGSTYSWADGPPFTQSDVSGLANFKELSFVCSHACVTGNYEAGECFGETWVREPNKAAIIFWGSSANTLWDEDDVLEKLTLSYYFAYGPVAQMTDNGKIGLYGHYGGSGYSRYYMECYNIFGDPSVAIGTSYSGGGGGGQDDVYFTPPRVGISSPDYWATVNGTVEIKGYAYGVEAAIKYVFIKIGDSDWMQTQGREEWTYSWDSNTVEDGEILFQAISIDKKGFQSGADFVRVHVLNHPPEPDPEPKIPNLTCEGELQWDQINPGEVVNGTITLSNIGDNESLLNWSVSDFPEDWGRWTINPSEGVNLTPESGPINILINIEAPTDEEQNFSGSIRIENLDDPDDFEVINIALSTSKEKTKDFPLYSWIMDFIREHFLNLFIFFQG